VQEQKRIAGILAALDDKIELNRRMNETLEGMARAIFQSWFVDFDPVIDNALATGHAIPAELEEKAARRKQQKKNHPLPKVIQKLFPDAFEPSAMGPIPKGWNTGCFGDIASNLKRPVKAGEADAHTAYIGLEHMPRQSIALDSWGTASEVESNKFAFNAGEILFGKLRPYFHKVGVPVTSGICSTDILVIAPKADDFFGLALSHASSTALIEFTTASSSGTRMPRTNWSDMSKYKIVLPSSKVVSHLNTIVAGHVSKIKNAIFESRALTHLRDTLLPKLLSGEIEV
jgi:type I restriction enzyme S subunit